MRTDVLTEFREGLATGEFTMTQLASITGIPLATLSDMKDESWRPQLFDRFEKLDRAIGQIRAEKSQPQGKQPTAA